MIVIEMKFSLNVQRGSLYLSLHTIYLIIKGNYIYMALLEALIWLKINLGKDNKYILLLSVS